MPTGQANRGKTDCSTHSLFTTHARRCGYDIFSWRYRHSDRVPDDGPGRTTERQYIECNLNVITTRAGRLRSEEPEIEPELVTTVQ